MQTKWVVFTRNWVKHWPDGTSSRTFRKGEEKKLPRDMANDAIEEGAATARNTVTGKRTVDAGTPGQRETAAGSIHTGRPEGGTGTAAGSGPVDAGGSAEDSEED